MLLEKTLQVSLLVRRSDDETGFEITRAHGAGKIHDHVAELVVTGPACTFLPSFLAAVFTAAMLAAFSGCLGRFFPGGGFVPCTGGSRREGELMLQAGQKDKLRHRETNGR